MEAREKEKFYILIVSMGDSDGQLSPSALF